MGSRGAGLRVWALRVAGQAGPRVARVRTPVPSPGKLREQRQTEAAADEGMGGTGWLSLGARGMD